MRRTENAARPFREKKVGALYESALGAALLLTEGEKSKTSNAGFRPRWQMRLTLRTLLAWLDDTLQPTQVKEIGSQVAGSPFAQELTERIHRVTRQRRLAVPSSSGPDGVDPNIVASYLDNELDPEEVADY